MSSKSSVLIKRITITAVMTAMAVVVKCVFKFALTIPVFGVQLSFGGIFTFFPAILFGPIYGGVASALTDLLGALIAPTGAYIPWLTVTAFAGGVIKGLIWKWLKKGMSKKLTVALASVMLFVGVVGASFTVALNADGVMHGVAASQTSLPEKAAVEQMVEDGTLSPLSRAAVSLAKYNKNTEKNPDNYRKYLATDINLLTLGLEITALVGIAVVVGAYFIGRKKEDGGISYPKIFASILGSGLIVTTVNTFILKAFISSYAERAVLILWVPRVCEEVLICALQAIIISLLYGVLKRTKILDKI